MSDNKDISEALDGLKDEAMAAGADLLDEAQKRATEALGGVSGAVSVVVDDIFDGTEAIPEISEAPGVKFAVDKSLESISDGLQTQLLLAVETMKSASMEAAVAGATVLGEMEKLASLMARGKIGARSAEMALENYLHALDLVRSRLDNEAKVQAYVRGRNFLVSGMQVAFSLLRFGIQAAAPGTTNLLSGLSTAAAGLIHE